jgi:hypothetical protein
MSDDIKKVQKGQPMRISAAFYNGAVDAINDLRRRQQAQERWQMQPANQPSVILVKNMTGTPRQRFEVLGLDTPVILPSVNCAGFQDKLAMNAIAPTTAMAGKYVVLQEPLNVGSIGKGLISGVTQVRIGTIAPETLGTVLWKDSSWALVALGGSGGADVNNGILAGIFSNVGGYDAVLGIYDLRAQNLDQRVTQMRICPHLYLYGCTNGTNETPDLLYDFNVTAGTFTGTHTLPVPQPGLLPGQVFTAFCSTIAPNFPGGSYVQGKYEIRIGKGDLRRLTVNSIPSGNKYQIILGTPTWPSRKTTGGFYAFYGEFVGGYLYPNIADYPNVKFLIGSNDSMAPGGNNWTVGLVDHAVDLTQYTAAGKTAVIEPVGLPSDICVLAYEMYVSGNLTYFIPTGTFKG